MDKWFGEADKLVGALFRWVKKIGAKGEYRVEMIRTR